MPEGRQLHSAGAEARVRAKARRPRRGVQRRLPDRRPIASVRDLSAQRSGWV